nr:hypothetical protein [Candidatus Omnitrophota bacterium]
RLLEDMSMLKDIKVKRCAEHGDFDFYSNILYKDGKVSLVDFERLKKDGLPFFDLVTLITHPFLFAYRSKKGKVGRTDFLIATGAVKLMRDWLNYYSSVSGMDKRLAYNAIKIVLLEHGTRDYPNHWPGDRYPLNDMDVLRELSAIDFSVKPGN